MHCRYLVWYFEHRKAYLEGTSFWSPSHTNSLFWLLSLEQHLVQPNRCNFGSTADTTANPERPSVLTVVLSKVSRWWWRRASHLHTLLILNRLATLPALHWYIFPWKICVQKLHRWPVTGPVLVAVSKNHKIPFPGPTSLFHLILPTALKHFQSFKYMPNTCKVNRCILRYHRKKLKFSVIYSSFIVNSVSTVSTLTVSLPKLFAFLKKLFFFLPSFIMGAYNYAQVFLRDLIKLFFSENHSEKLENYWNSVFWFSKQKSSIFFKGEFSLKNSSTP